MKRVLVTGAGGFVGTRLCTRLAQQGVHVVALHRRPRPGPWQQEILVDLAAEALAVRLPPEIDTVFHLAGHAHAGEGSRTLHQRVSVAGTRWLLGQLGGEVSAFVYLSSVKAMGETTPLQCVDETAPCLPSTAYGEARRDAEQLVAAAAGGNLRTTILRAPLVYGAGARGNLERLMRAVLKRRMPMLPEFGNRRSMIHVDDVCAAAMLAAQRSGANTRTYLLDDGMARTPHQLVAMMYAAAGTTPLLPPVPRWLLQLAAAAGDVLGLPAIGRLPFNSATLARLRSPACYSAALLARETGFRPCHDLASALPAMLQRVREASR